MAEKFRVTMNDKQEVVKVEANIDGKWVASNKVEPASGGGASSESGGCGQGTTYCLPIPGFFVIEINRQCFYFPC